MLAKTRMRLLGAAVIMSALAALLALVAFSPAAQANHSWNGYHWARTSNPFTLKLGDNVSSTWNGYLKTTSADWTASTVLDTKVVQGKKDPATCRPTSGRVEVCNYTYGANGWLGLAQVWLSGTHIVAGTSKVNDTYFNTATYNTPAWRNLAMCQEVGHTLGLDHQDEIKDNPNLGSCMDYTNDPDGGLGGASATDPSNEHPNQHDYDQLQTIYSHLDSITTVGSANAASNMPLAARRGEFNSSAVWGRKVHESRNGQLALYERDFGGGKKVFTFVVWA